ncbi:MAG: hypothetical protein MUQ10_19955, partial [Anaerolineae bacterium]|nr:hypothetical protein [Anaerolineae bacterium]
MNEDTSDFGSDLRISPTVPILTLWVLGTAIAMWSNRSTSNVYGSGVTNLVLLLFGVSATALVLDRWKAWAGRLGAIAAWAAAIYFGSGWLHMPGLLALMGLPVLLAIPLLSMRAAVAIAIGESLFLIASAGSPSAGAELSSVTVALAVIWGTIGTLYYALYRPLNDVVEWTETHYEHARRLFVDTGNSRVEMEQAFEALTAANRRLALANERITRLRRVAEEAERTKTTFVANVSHEFRTPLNMIIGLVEIMVENPELYAVTLTPRIREDLNIVYRNSKHLGNMINDVLDLTRAQTGWMAIHREPVDLRKLIEASAEVVSPLLDKKRLNLRL